VVRRIARQAREAPAPNSDADVTRAEIRHRRRVPVGGRPIHTGKTPLSPSRSDLPSVQRRATRHHRRRRQRHHRYWVLEHAIDLVSDDHNAERTEPVVLGATPIATCTLPGDNCCVPSSSQLLPLAGSTEQPFVVFTVMFTVPPGHSIFPPADDN